MEKSAKGLVVITGASSGIGEACATYFSEKGHPLLLLARRLDRMEALKLPNTLCRAVDVTDLAGLSAAVAEAETAYGPVSCLINNAGVMLLGKIITQDPAEFQKMVDVNIVGVLNGVKAVIHGMVERKDGCIINVSSVAGRKTFTNHAAYCATKFGVHALTETLREEYSQSSVKFIVVAPGVTETELLGHTTDASVVDGYKKWKTEIEPLQSEDVARACYFAYDQPRRCCIREIVLAPTLQMG